jgi:uncharacterized protein (TIGR02996 family)
MFLVEITAPDGSIKRQLEQPGSLAIGSNAGCAVRIAQAASIHARIELRVAHSSITVSANAELDGDDAGDRERVMMMPLSIGIAGHKIVIRDITPPRFEASYGAIAAEEAALVDAIVTGDVASRIVYADWLEERGDHARAEIVRRLAAGEKPDAELLLLLAPTNVRWRARILEPVIEGCPRARLAGSGADVACPGHWGALERTGRADMRRCDRCLKLAQYCVDGTQAHEHRAAGGVVVFDPFSTRELWRPR